MRDGSMASVTVSVPGGSRHRLIGSRTFRLPPSTLRLLPSLYVGAELAEHDVEHVGIRQRRIREQSRLGGEQYGLLAGVRGWGSVGAVDQAGVERNTARSRIKTQLDWIIPWLAVDVYRSGVGRSAIVAQPPVVRLPAMRVGNEHDIAAAPDISQLKGGRVHFRRRGLDNVEFFKAFQPVLRLAGLRVLIAKAVNPGLFLLYERILARGLHSISCGIYMPRGQFALSLAADEEVANIIRFSGLMELMWGPILTMSWVYWLTGQYRLAAVRLDELRAILLPNSLADGYWHYIHGNLAIESGDFETARSMAATCLTLPLGTSEKTLR